MGVFSFLDQLRPNFHPEGLFGDNKVPSSSTKEKSKPIYQIWHLNGRCPENTVPIRRTKRDDILRASSVKRYGRKKHQSIPQPRSVEPELFNQNGHQVFKFIIRNQTAFVFIFFSFLFFYLVILSIFVFSFVSLE